ncbi:MAG: DUF427 domain-containing protein [Acidimicrobiia bacterium]
MSKLRPPEDGPKRVRAFLGGELVADTKRVKLVWENPSFPQYYFPIADVRAELVPTETRTHSPSRGDATHFTVKTSTGAATDAAWQYTESRIEELRGLVRLDWHAMDGWFEEDVEVFTHPRSPYTRVDVLDSSRHVRVLIEGVTVAESHHPKLLFETGLPTRFYLPKVDVDLRLLVPTDTESHCPYKGTARYWSAHIGDSVIPDIAWSYATPLPESETIAGLVAFYNEKVDHVVDGEALERPHTQFS